MIGQRLSPILEEIEDTLLEIEALGGGKPNFTEEGFRASIKIFMSTVLDKMWELQEKENMDIEIRQQMATKAGESVRQLVKTYCDIDTFDLYKEKI